MTPDSQCESKLISNRQVRGINEIYRNFGKAKIDRMYHNNGEQRYFVQSLNNDISKGAFNEEINIFVFNYDNRDPNWRATGVSRGEIPTTKEIEFLCDLLASTSNDVIVPPIMSYLSGDDYLEFLKKFFDALPSHRPNVVMGVIPAYLHRFEFPGIIDFYEKKGVRLFLMDLHGGTTETHYVDINLVLRKFANIERASRENCYLHGLNISYGKPLLKTPAAPAKDVASFYLGFDSIGPTHLGGLRLRSDLYSKLPTSVLTPHPPRLYNRADYGYYRSDFVGTTNFHKEQDVRYEIKDFDVGKTPLKHMAKIFNAERIGIEAKIIRSQLESAKTLRGYVESKKHFQGQDFLANVLSLRSEILGQAQLS